MSVLQSNERFIYSSKSRRCKWSHAVRRTMASTFSRSSRTLMKSCKTATHLGLGGRHQHKIILFCTLIPAEDSKRILRDWQAYMNEVFKLDFQTG